MNDNNKSWLDDETIIHAWGRVRDAAGRIRNEALSRPLGTGAKGLAGGIALTAAGALATGLGGLAEVAGSAVLVGAGIGACIECRDPRTGNLRIPRACGVAAAAGLGLIVAGKASKGLGVATMAVGSAVMVGSTVLLAQGGIRWAKHQRRERSDSPDSGNSAAQPA